MSLCSLSIVVFLVKRFIKRSLATLENYDEWKERRRVFNPAFTQRFDSLSLLNNKYDYSDFQASCNGKPKSVERHLHSPMCSVSVVTVVFIHTMEDDQRLNTLVHEGDALRFSVYHCKKPENRCN